MQAIHILLRATCAAFLSLAMLCAAMPRQAGAAIGSPSLAGHWVAQLVWHCEPGHGPGLVCGRADHAPGAVTLAITMDIVSDAAGSATFQYEATLAGSGSDLSPLCDAQLWRSTAFTGLCYMTGHGKGYFSPASWYFYVYDEWVTFYGPSMVRAVHNPMAAGGIAYPEMWPIPTQQGYYRDGMLDLGPSPAGVHAEEVLVRY